MEHDAKVSWWWVVAFCFVFILSIILGFLTLSMKPPKPAPEYPVIVHVIESNGRVVAIYAENWKNNYDLRSCTSFNMIWPSTAKYQRMIKKRQTAGRRVNETENTYYEVGYWKEYQPK